jgi:hypothetical protein
LENQSIKFINYSEWDTLIKGVPQGSILGPVLFNVFINDIFHFVQDSTIYNYADDNTLSYSDTNISKFRWESTVMPKSLTFSSHVILFPFKSKDKLCLFVLGPMAIA